MKYEELLQKNLNEYTDLNNKYQEMIQSEKMRQVMYNVPFDFLKCRFILDTLSVYSDLSKTSKDNANAIRINFTSGNEAIQRFLDIVNFKNVANSILEDATFVVELSKLQKQINNLVQDSAYLSPSMMVEPLGKLEKIAEDCLKEIPQYKSLMTKEFRLSYIESCIDSLSKEDLSKLLAARIIKGKDLDKITLTGSEKYLDNVKYLCEITGHTKIIEKSYPITLKGVSFKDDNGTSRQDYLKEIKQMLSKNETPNIKVVASMYKPDIGPEEPSIHIVWNDTKCLGHLPKETAKELAQKYENPNYEAKVTEITGGGQNCNYGCKIEFNILSSKFKENQEEVHENIR